MARINSIVFCSCIALSIILSSCRSGSNGSSTLLPNITGKPGQILVVAPVQIKDTPLADSLRAVLGAEYPMIPQHEPAFDLTFIPESAFDRVLQPFRNILFIRTSPDSAQSSLRLATDKWAAPQSVAYLSGANVDSLAAWVGTHAYTLYQTFTEAEQKRLMDGYRKVHNADLSSLVAKRFGVRMDIPSGFATRVDKPDFCWLSLETKDISQGIFVYEWGNFGSPFVPDTLVAHQNFYTHRDVPGPSPNSYMQVAEVIPPEVQALRFGGDTLVRMRGLWDVRGHAMGGAFVSYSHLSADRLRVVTTVGYIYAPRFKKREYMRQLEAVLLGQVGEE